MIKIIKNGLKTTNECIILATPLIIFLSLLNWYGNYAVDAADTLFKQIFAGITMFIMACGFLSAFLYMAKKTIQLSKKIFVFDRDRANALIGLIASLPKGVGRLILPITGVIAIYIFIYLGMLFITSYFADKYAITSSNVNLLIVIEFSCILYLTLLWLPEIVYNEKNAFKALFKSIKKLFFNFKPTIKLYLYFTLLLAGIFLLNSQLLYHPIVAFFVLIIFYYILVHIIVLLFSYYEQNFVE